jgi:hypothetical protein
MRNREYRLTNESPDFGEIARSLLPADGGLGCLGVTLAFNVPRTAADGETTRPQNPH